MLISDSSSMIAHALSYMATAASKDASSEGFTYRILFRDPFPERER